MATTTTTTTTITLKTVIFMGSAKDQAAPYGGDKRLGDRVLGYVTKTLADHKGTLGNDNNNIMYTIVHDIIQVIDPKDVFDPETGAFAEFSAGDLRVPMDHLEASQIPSKAKALSDMVASADCYLIISPEYNHMVPPALASVMGHFDPSVYACKPSAVIGYSPSPYGGSRGAVAINTMCRHLGCLTVSRMVGFCKAYELFDESGSPRDPNHRMFNQFKDMLDHLEWMAVAMKKQRDLTGPVPYKRD